MLPTVSSNPTSIAFSSATRYFNAHTQIMLLRVSRDHYEALWSAMTLMSSFNQRPCLFRVIHLSGTIRSSQKHLLAFQQRALKRMARDATHPGGCPFGVPYHSLRPTEGGQCPRALRR